MEKFHFICQKWLAVEKDDGKPEQHVGIAGVFLHLHALGSNHGRSGEDEADCSGLDAVAENVGSFFLALVSYGSVVLHEVAVLASGALQQQQRNVTGASVCFSIPKFRLMIFIYPR